MTPQRASGTANPGTFSASGYWYDADTDDDAVDVLNALRAYRAAESDMRQRTRTSMKMGETDLTAIRFLLKAQETDRPVSARELADALGITTASTSVLINRLVGSGHLERHAHPTDRRGVLITATEGSDDEVRATMRGMHARMIAVAEGLGAAEARTVVAFLRGMTEAVEQDLGEVQAVDDTAHRPENASGEK